ncbi:MAG: hypothetical protein OWR52_07780 [Acidibacillus sp.]|uniref:Uncharacterized protein n=1 Tax=Sulfoacidibacillus ferrooxidans TaxID=2005001 RepID=A0A9X2AD55_9BACL|nr:hypothetical protein [Sulfoacidibacillus ferrooxidans]MCI0181947.1 hypothetical protein [Sulfoacidibacillus ferrooxidans]MCY0893391.1 hypothetical protein [Acidibacillus sp.]
MSACEDRIIDARVSIRAMSIESVEGGRINIGVGIAVKPSKKATDTIHSMEEKHSANRSAR